MILTYQGKEFIDLGMNPHELIGTKPNIKYGDTLLDENGNAQSSQVHYPDYWNNGGVIQEVKCKVYAKIYVAERNEVGYMPIVIRGGYKALLTHLITKLLRPFPRKEMIEWA